MFGISSTVFSEAGGLVKDWLKNPLNSSFLYWYFLPAAGLVLTQLFLIGPALGYPTPKLLDAQVQAGNNPTSLILEILSSSIFALVLLPMIIAVVLSALSGAILRLYQGMLPATRPFFRMLLRRNQRRSSDFYGPLELKRREYMFLISSGIRFVNTDDGERTEYVPESEREDLADKLRAEIQTLHEHCEKHSSAHELPVDVERVGPTNLANTLAVAEEYPFARYGIDTAVFWPRLCAELEPEKMESLSINFGAMNGLLNISFLSYLFAVECLVIVGSSSAGWIATQHGPLLRFRWLVAAAVVSLLVGWGTYRAAVRAAYSVGNALRTAFDYHRGRILEQFNLKLPENIEEERVAWLKLAAFIRRGESFYYPSEFRLTGNNSSKIQSSSHGPKG